MLVPGATVPQRLGRFEISSHLASGGMAEIYLARSPAQREPVVVKVITRERATDDNFIQMFLDEARVIATLNHPNIARLLEIGKDGQVYFLAMEFVRGETVRAVLEKGARAKQRVPYDVVLGIAARVAHALHHAHDRKSAAGALLDIVHRDVTPSNVMVGFDGVVKLLDFGVARAKGRSQETVSGTVKGKFAYMAPEQCLGKRVDRRADVFSLGILMYEMATLRRAFRAESDYDTLTKIVQGDIAAPSTLVKDFPPALEKLIQHAMTIDVDVRFQTAAELGAAIEECARELGGIAGPAELKTFMRERFPASAGADDSDDGVVIERVEPARSRPVSSAPPAGQPSVGRAPTGPVPSFSPALVPAPPREQRITGGQPLFAPQGTPVQPTPLAQHADWGAADGAQQKTMMGYLAPTPGARIPTPLPGAPRPAPITAPPPSPTPMPFAAASPIPSAVPTPMPFGAAPPPSPTPMPFAAPMPDAAAQVSLPPPPAPDRGLPWALPVALVAIALVTLALVATILLT